METIDKYKNICYNAHVTMRDVIASHPALAGGEAIFPIVQHKKNTAKPLNVDYRGSWRCRLLNIIDRIAIKIAVLLGKKVMYEYRMVNVDSEAVKFVDKRGGRGDGFSQKNLGLMMADQTGWSKIITEASAQGWEFVTRWDEDTILVRRAEG